MVAEEVVADKLSGWTGMHLWRCYVFNEVVGLSVEGRIPQKVVRGKKIMLGTCVLYQGKGCPRALLDETTILDCWLDEVRANADARL